ncbi:MAG: tRNA (adenosine(37)-N6)-threonylcarbamoyltransferase complex transferase subunit TsaD [Burkholderiales bacterium]|nr:tRNA (adenosine(37)-N6)-threonylcarbamoyltransferase complex transferase subunit TsaD [Phycisphaerae bacterium]
MAMILGIESTCDETAAAVVADGVDVRSSVIATQFELHEIYRGVVPEIASRAHIENIVPVIHQALDEAHCRLADIGAIAVAQRPGLIGSLLIGVTAAKTLAWSLEKPLLGVDHVQAHLYSVVLRGKGEGAARVEGEGVRRKVESSLTPYACPLTPHLPAIGLVCSGGHTALYLIKSWSDVTLIGATIDDAIGEAYDKVAGILGLGYPGGPAIDQLAPSGNPKAIAFPRSRLDRDSLDFSFSGLKTSVLYHVRGHKGRERDPGSVSQAELHDICASFQQACIDILLIKLGRAVERFGARSVIVGGGVSANRGLRAALTDWQRPAYFPRMEYCTDNAAMIAGFGHILLDQGITGDLSMDAVTSSRIRRIDAVD